MIIYESVELSQFEMFKEETKTSRHSARAHLDKIKMTHRLMDGNLLQYQQID
jgi:hypothetical protein